MDNYLPIIPQGFTWGFILALMIGPVFFGLIQTSIEEGLKKAIVYALGVAFSDFCFVLLAVIGISPLIEKAGWKDAILVVGGIVMMIFGVLYLKKSAEDVTYIYEAKKITSRKRKYFLKGFLLNSLNPAVLFFWIGPVGFVIADYSDVPGGAYVFLATALSTVFLTDIAKAWSARRILSWLNPRHINQMNKILGVAFIIAGIIILWKVFTT